MILVLLAAVSGFVNGFFAAGGGIFVVIATYVYCKSERENADFIKKQLATANAVIFLLSLTSLVFFALNGNITAEDLAFTSKNLLPGSVIGSVIGALLLKYVNGTLLKKGFALVIAYSGIRMIVG